MAAEAARLARDHLLAREQFGCPLTEFERLRWISADVETELTAARHLPMDAAQSGSLPCRIKAAQAKPMASEIAIRVVDRAPQMFGAQGYCDAHPPERMCRDVRMFTIGGGTAQSLRYQIAARVLGKPLPQRCEAFDVAFRDAIGAA